MHGTGAARTEVRARRLLWGRATLAVLAVVATVVTLGSWSPWGLSSETLSVFAGVLGAGCCLYAAVLTAGAARRSWCFFALVMMLYAAGDMLWLVFGGAEGTPPILSLADALYLVALVPAILGLVFYPVARRWRGAMGPLVFDVAVLGAAVLLVSHVLVFDEVVRGAGGFVDAFMLLVYPITDALLTCLVVLLLLRSVGDPRPDLVLIGLCFATYTLADNAYALMTVRGQDIAGTVVDLGYIIAPLCLGLAALGAPEHARGTRTMQRHLGGVVAQLLPDLGVFGALALFATLHRSTGSVTWIIAITAVALTGVRQLALTADRQRLRADLERRVASRTEDLRLLTQEHERLEAMKYEFVTAVSHELRTPLTAIRGSLELLADGDAGKLPSAAERVVAMAARGSQRLSRLVDDIIDLERLERGAFSFQPTPQPLAPLLADAVAPLRRLAEDRGVELVLLPTTAAATCDGDRTIQAVVNLVGNALKFSPNGGTVTISAQEDGDEVVIAVADQGRGIPADQLESIFERFHQVEDGDHREHAGAGLGLPITKYIVEGHAGRIWVESAVNVGSTFRFTLPRAVLGDATGASTAPAEDPAVALPVTVGH